MFIRCRMFQSKPAGFLPLANVIALSQVVQANDYPITVQDEDGGNRADFLLISIRFASGEVIRVESTDELREALNLGPAEPALQLLMSRATRAGQLQ